MAIRVKKLAKQLQATPEVILLALSDLGYSKYKSPTDMVADNAAAKVRTLARKVGLPKVRQPPPPAPPPKPAPTPKPAARQAAARQAESRQARSPSTRPPESAARAEPRRRHAPVAAPPGRHVDPLDIPISALAQAPVASPASSEDAERIREEERRLQAQSNKLAERARELEQAHAELEAARARVQAERDRLKAERAALIGEVEALGQQLEERARALDAVEAGGVPLVQLLDERGLRGADEHGRTLNALARERLLDRVLPRLRVVDPGPIRRLLRERVVLAPADTPTLSGVAMVSVTSDRSEVPAADKLDRFRQDLAGEFLLAGLTRGRLVGGGLTPLLLRMVTGDLDPRLSFDVRPAITREASDVASDTADVDVVILWGVEETDEARAAYDAAAVPVVRIAGDGGLNGLLAGVREGLLQV